MENLVDVIFRAFTADQIASGITNYKSDTTKEIILEEMENNRYDVIGAEDNYGKLIGYFQKDSNLNRLEYVSPINSQLVISGDSPLKEVIIELQDKDFVFVLNKTEINKIITKADIGKQPVRIYLFGLISTFEVTISKFIIDKGLTKSEIEEMISPNAFKKADEIYKDRVKYNIDIDFVYCLNLVDKKEIILKNEELISVLKIKNKSKFSRYVSKLNRFRNSLVHGYDFMKLQSDIKRIVEIIKFVEEYTELQ
jgi:uncharacterized protein YutE (UPF0331/DUF86 family)